MNSDMQRVLVELSLGENVGMAEPRTETKVRHMCVIQDCLDMERMADTYDLN